MKYFFCKISFFFINSKPLWKHVFYDTFRNNHRKTPGLESPFDKVAELKPCSFIKMRPQHRYFHENIAKFITTAFFIKHLRWLLLNKGKTNLKST